MHQESEASRYTLLYVKQTVRPYCIAQGTVFNLLQ